MEIISAEIPSAEPIRQAASAHPGTAAYPSWTADLPQVVWLRGDEPYGGEFSLDADAVMQELGIKRSRLTQISGTELRVGRTRIDRYIRPVYRPCDIEDYQKWTRATATHHKSSTLLEQAAHKLELSSRDFAEQLADLHHKLSTHLSRQLHGLEKQLGSSQGLRLAELLALSEAQHRRREQSQQRLNQTGLRQLTSLQSEVKEVQQSLSTIAGFAPQLEELRSLLCYLQQALVQLQQTAAKQKEHLASQLAELLQQLLKLHERFPVPEPSAQPQRSFGKKAGAARVFSPASSLSSPLFYPRPLGKKPR